MLAQSQKKEAKPTTYGYNVGYTSTCEEGICTDNPQETYPRTVPLRWSFQLLPKLRTTTKRQLWLCVETSVCLIQIQTLACVLIEPKEKRGEANHIWLQCRLCQHMQGENLYRQHERDSALAGRDQCCLIQIQALGSAGTVATVCEQPLIKK